MAFFVNPEAKVCADKVAESCHRKFGLLVGSGTTSLALACRMAPVGRKRVIVPAISCIHVLYAILYAECEPVFVDVLPNTGLLDPEAVRQALERDPVIGAVIVVHTYGYVADVHAIASIARSKSVLVIEDAAQAQGGSYADGSPVGSLGDLSLVSFGHTKILDLGSGGVLMMDSQEMYSACLALMENLAVTPINLDDLLASFRSNYYSNWRLRTSDPLALSRIGKLYLSYSNVFIHRSDNATPKRVITALPRLQDRVAERRELASKYTFRLADVTEIQLCRISSGSVPWRFVFLAPENERESLLERLRCGDVDASSWYPSLAPFYKSTSDPQDLPNSAIFERKVINLWTTPGYGVRRVDLACDLIRGHFGR